MATLFVFGEFEHSLILRVKCNGGLERVTRLAAYKAFDHGRCAVYHKGDELRIGQILFRNGAKYGKSTVLVVTLGNF